MAKRPVEGAPLVPPRWLHCPRKGMLIADKFIPFKTPLDSKYDSQVPDQNKFYPEMLMASVESAHLKKIGLIIDLTNTTRFYDKSTIESADCKYLKLQCRGHGETPSEEQTQTFINICYNFIRQKPLEVVGVHCTHGFNRSGFLIISYLIEKMDWSAGAALQCFSQARAPGIYKEDYILELFTRYDDPSFAPPAPELPSWCTESDDSKGLDDDGLPIEAGGPSSSKRGRRDKDGSKSKVISGVNGLLQVLDQPRLSQIQSRVQKMCGWTKGGFPGSQPVSMDQQNIFLLAKMPYKVSWKADGTRFMMLIDGPGNVFLVDRDNCVFHAPKLQFPRRKDLSAHVTNTLVDGELVLDEDKASGRKTPRFLIYDIIKFDGHDLAKDEFDLRSTCIRRELEQPRYEKVRQGALHREVEPFGVRLKEFYPIRQSTAKLLSPSFGKKLGHEVDGLVFQPAGKGNTYQCGKQEDVLKWKPPHLNSVDFKLKWVKEGRPGMLPVTTGQLFVGGLDTPFGQLKFSKKHKDLEGKIVECMWNFESNHWEIMRERTDKSFPNAYATAVAVVDSIKKPVTEKVLLQFIAAKGWREHEGMPPPPTVPAPASRPKV